MDHDENIRRQRELVREIQALEDHPDRNTTGAPGDFGPAEEYDAKLANLAVELAALVKDTLPTIDPLTEYAESITGGPLDTIADWQHVARTLFEERQLPENATARRTVTFYPRHEPNGPEEFFLYNFHVIMDWVKDEDGLPRTEIGHGRTEGEAWALALHIAAEFMAEDHVDATAWPSQLINKPTESEA